MKTGIGAYEEIKKLAEKVYGNGVSVQSAIFGDEYIILDSNKELLRGKTDLVREELKKCNTPK